VVDPWVVDVFEELEVGFPPWVVVVVPCAVVVVTGLVVDVVVGGAMVVVVGRLVVGGDVVVVDAPATLAVPASTAMTAMVLAVALNARRRPGRAP
jgi:hypothetical protein